MKKKTSAAPSVDQIFMQPWFLSNDLSLEIRTLLPSVHLKKMHYYFEDYGCLHCGSRIALYGSNGMCESCSIMIRKRIERAMKARLRAVNAPATALQIRDTRLDSAREVLQRLSIMRRRSET